MTIETNETTTKRLLTPYEVVEYCPVCVDNGVPLEYCELTELAVLPCSPPKYRVACSNDECGYPGPRYQRTQNKPPRRVEYEKGAFIK